MKLRISKIFIIFSFFQILLVGCRKEEIDLINARVEVVLPPQGVGDQGYNDKILRGFQKASVKYGFTLAIHIPEVKEQGADIYDEWLTSKLSDDCERSLFVFSGSEYEYLLDSLDLPEDDRKDVVMFESEHHIDGIYTFHVGCYAASYMAGASSVLVDEKHQKALVIAANTYDNHLKRAVDGYRDGYLAAGGNACDIHYLSEDVDGGYQMQDEAYRYCMENKDDYMFFFSAAGASNKGMYRFSRENLTFAVGMDDDMSLFSYLIGISVVKHMDRAITDVLGDLLNNVEIPYHQDFTYLSGYEELVYKSSSIEEIYPDISELRKQIVEIEQRYEEFYQ